MCHAQGLYRSVLDFQIHLLTSRILRGHLPRSVTALALDLPLFQETMFRTLILYSW